MSSHLAFGPGVFKYEPTVRTLEIARAGLRHWHPRAEASAPELVARVVTAANEGLTERRFIRDGFEAVTDPRWVGVLFSTVVTSVYNESRLASYETMGMREHYRVEIDTLTCRIPLHGKLSGMACQADSEVLAVVRAPFDWMCGCSQLLICDRANLRNPGKALTGKSALFNRGVKWMSRSPDREAAEYP